MTIDERAEKMLPQLKWFIENNENGFPYLVDQIRAAVEEDRKEYRKTMADDILKNMRNVRAEAYEDAAKRLEGDVLETPDDFDPINKLKVFQLLEKIAKEFRARAKEVTDK